MGEQLSFYHLFTQKEYRIEIPIIQRDYAQGRKSAFEVRNDFLEAIHKYFIEDIPLRDLDFVYGDIDQSGNLVLLDGQQRLTTLFLLHWYLALKDNKYSDFKSILYKDEIPRFTYKTRQSSNDFCNALLKNGVDLRLLLPADENTNNELSKTIGDSSWYFSSWYNDPTIQSMLCMLDAIHQIFKETKGYFNKLIDETKPIITFQFLPLKEHGLTDDLYIKMNSRGKPLTKFENFKAKFEQHIAATSKNTYLLKYTPESEAIETDAITYFSHKIDTEWTSVFWTYRNKQENLYDKQLMYFISTIAINHSALLRNDVKQFIDNQASLPIRFYTQQNEQFITTLIATFNYLCSEPHFKEYLKNFNYYNESHAFEKIINKSFSDAGYLERIQFCAYYSFLVQWKGEISGFSDWMRVIVNLSANSVPYNNETEFVNSIRSIDKLLPYSNNIYAFLKSKGNIGGFNPTQIKEERIKAHLITKNEDWSNKIAEYEQHKYFNGQLTFALAFSGIEKYYDEFKNCDWSETEDITYCHDFDKYIKLVFALFDANGLKQEAKENHRFHRALLTKGDYLLEAQANDSFLIDNHRDISWKRLLLGDENRKEKRAFVKQIIEDVRFDTDNLCQLDSFHNIEDDMPKWRKVFIRLPELFNDFGSFKYLRFKNGPADSVYLLKGVKMSGQHSELFTRALYLELNGKFDSTPFQSIGYYPVSGESDEPCLYFNKWAYQQSEFALDIFYQGKDTFKIKFFDRMHQEICEDILQILLKYKFEQNGRAFEVILKEADLKTTLIDLCMNFEAIK